MGNKTNEIKVKNPIIIVGGGLAGLSAAYQAYLRGANIILVDKQGFLSGNSGKATSGINGTLTRTQVKLSINDSIEKFYQDTLAAAKDRANPELIKVLIYQSADAVHWLEDVLKLDLSIVSRLGGHSQPRTHRGKGSKFPGMAITYKAVETLEALSKTEPNRVFILKNTQVVDLLKNEQNEYQIVGVLCKNLVTKEKYKLSGPVIMATGGYAADFTKNSLLRKYRPDIIDLPSTNGNHATGDGQKIIMKNKGIGIDLDKVQVHPTGLINLNDLDVINGRKKPRFLFLGAEALRGEGGIMLNCKGERFVNELGTRDYVSEEIEKQIKQCNGPIRLVLNEKAESNLQLHIKHYKSRNLMKTITGKELLEELDCTYDKLSKQFNDYNKAANKEVDDPFGKQFFPNCPFVFSPNANYYISFVTRVLHFTMGGVKINDKSQVLYEAGNDIYAPFEGLYAAGELAGGIHGHNRLGGSSLLACVVFGRLAADEATSYYFQKLINANKTATNRLKLISLHIDPINPQQISIYLSGSNINSHDNLDNLFLHTNNPIFAAAKKSASSSVEKTFSQFKIPKKEFTIEEVAEHNKSDDCWCIIKNIVLDLTSFLENHPGGKESIINFAGKDATESYEMLHDDDFIVKYAKENILGRVKDKNPTLMI